MSMAWYQWQQIWIKSMWDTTGENRHKRMVGAYVYLNVSKRRETDSVVWMATCQDSTHRAQVYTGRPFGGDTQLYTYDVYYFNNYIRIYLWDDGSNSYYNYVSSSATPAYGDVEPPVFLLSPSSGYLYPTKDTVIKVYAETNNWITTQYTIQSGTLLYKTESDSAYSSIALVDGSATFTAGTLKTGHTYTMYASVVADDGKTYQSNSFTYSTIDDTAASVVSEYPNNGIYYKAVTFEWSYVNQYGNDQNKFDLQISKDLSTWTDIASGVVSASTTYDATISLSGTVNWRVRAYNMDNVATSWSDTKAFINNIPPEAPTITSVTGNGRITVKWMSTEQVAYQIQIGNYDTGAVYSTNKTVFINKYLVNGTYTVKVRIFNKYGKYSDWSTCVFAQNMNVASPSANITVMEGYNLIEIPDNSAYSKYYILRDGVVIAKVSSGMYFDYFCNGVNTYTIRAVTVNDDFADQIISITYTCKKPALISKDGSILYVNSRLDQKPSTEYGKTYDSEAVAYLGKTKPSIMMGTLITRTWSVICDQEIELGVDYFYRNIRGDKAWVRCTSENVTVMDIGIHEYQFTLTESDYSEAIDYELPN